MTMNVNIGGVWKEVSPKVNINGTWKDVETGYVNVGGVWKPFFENAGKYQILGDIIVNTATTQVNITGLSLDKDSEYLLVSDIVGDSSNYYYLGCNGNTTPSNYYAQVLNVYGGTLYPTRQNISIFANANSTSRTCAFSKIKLTNNGYFVVQNNASQFYNGSSCEVYDTMITSMFTVASITSLSIMASTGNGIAASSRFQLYKIGGA